MEPQETEGRPLGDPEVRQLMGELADHAATNGCVIVGHKGSEAVVFPVPVKDSVGQDVYFIVTSKSYGKVGVPIEDERRAKLLAADIQRASGLDRRQLPPEGRAGFYPSPEGGSIIMHGMGEAFRVDHITEADAPLLGEAYQRSQERRAQQGSPGSTNTAATTVLRQAMMGGTK